MAIKDTASVTVRELLDVLRAQGIATMVLSPGSRNTPLLVGAAAREDITKYVINDERTAAFTALGIAMASRQPVALICTSGTALYNYAPAVAEAYYQHIPLIIISADRPLETVGQQPQTLLQHGALDKIVKKSFDIPFYPEDNNEIPAFDIAEKYSNLIANEAYITAVSGVKGPVHINVHIGGEFNKAANYEETRSIRIIRNVFSNSALAPHIMRDIANYLCDKKIMIIAGSMLPDDRLNKAMVNLSTLANVCVIADPSSNLHLDRRIFLEGNISQYNDKSLKPDVVIALGGIPLSENVKRFVQQLNDIEFWSFADNWPSLDWSDKLTCHFDLYPAPFLRIMSILLRKRIKANDIMLAYKEEWFKVFDKIEKNNAKYLNQDVWNEETVYAKLFSSIPSEVNLFLSNGLTVRYANKFIKHIPHNCWANRGVSGIDGTNATAFGASLCYRGITLLVTGDMSFSYNTEILNLSRLGGDLRIIVINNRGGGIFRKINTTRDIEIREEYFCNDPQLPLQKLCDAYGWNYVSADSFDSLDIAFAKLLNTHKTLIEIKL